MGTETELKYTVDGNRVKVENPQGNIILTFHSDGSFLGPMGMKFSKVATSTSTKTESPTGGR